MGSKNTHELKIVQCIKCIFIMVLDNNEEISTTHIYETNYYKKIENEKIQKTITGKKEDIYHVSLLSTKQ